MISNFTTLILSRRRYVLILGLIGLCTFSLLHRTSAISPEGARPPAASDSWLTGTPDEKFEKLAEHHRGLDQAMWEIGYRYRELAWAGKQQDWSYAIYQIGKIQLTLEQAIERRPKRAANARLFITEGVEPLKQALAKQPVQDFPARFQQLTAACLACHAREQAPIMNLPAWAERDPSFPVFK